MELSVPRRHIVWNGVDHATSTSERDPRSDDPRHFDRDALTPLASTAWMTDDVAVAPLDRAAIDRTALRRELRELKTHELVRRGRPA